MGLRENRYGFNMDFLDSANAELQLQRLWYMHEDNDNKKKKDKLCHVIKTHPLPQFSRSNMKGSTNIIRTSLLVLLFDDQYVSAFLNGGQRILINLNFNDNFDHDTF